MESISLYYHYYVRGSSLAKSKRPDDIKMAISFLEKCLEYKKTKIAYNDLLVCYIIINDNESYEKTLLKAANDGFSYFYSSLGLLYSNNPVFFNKEKAVYWFNKGLEANEPKAFYDYSKMCVLGCKAFDKDVEKGIKLLNAGLELNNIEWNGLFCYAIATSYLDKNDYENGAKYLKKAVDYGYKEANFNLALLYRDGKGVEKDLDKYMDCLLNNYFKIAFSKNESEEDYAEEFDDIEKILGKSVREKLQECISYFLASKKCSDA